MVARNRSLRRNHTSYYAMKKRDEHEKGECEREDDDDKKELERGRDGREERSDGEWIANVCALRPSPHDAPSPREDGDGDEENEEEEEEEKSWKESAERDHHDVGRHPHRQPHRALRLLLVVVVV